MIVSLYNCLKHIIVDLFRGKSSLKVLTCDIRVKSVFQIFSLSAYDLELFTDAAARETIYDLYTHSLRYRKDYIAYKLLILSVMRRFSRLYRRKNKYP